MRARDVVMAVVLVMSISTRLAGQGVCSRDRAYGDVGIGLFQCVGADCLIAGRNSSEAAHLFLVEPRLWKLRPPAKAQLAEGDVLVAVDGTPVTTRRAGLRLAQLRPGDHVRLRIRRGSQTVEIALLAEASCVRPSVQLTSSPGDPDVIAQRNLARSQVTAGGTPQPVSGALGFVVQEDSRASSGVLPVVISVRPGSAAAMAGLTVGDTIVAVYGQPMSTLLGRQLFYAVVIEPLRVTVRRAGGRDTLIVVSRTGAKSPRSPK
jgi:C-terminal processing protease CtpA/Prc